MGVLGTQLLIIAVPVFAAWYTKKDFKQTFSLKLPKLTGIFGAILLEIGTFLFATLVSVALTYIWPQDAASLNESFALLLKDVGFIPALLVIALAPAICEEALFRGYFLAAAKKKFKPWTAILLVAAMFGIYHMSLIKFFSTGILGIALCYAAYKSGSIALSCIMHFINNAFSVVVLYYGEEVEQLFPILFKEGFLVSDILILLALSLICVSGGVFLIRRKATALKANGK